MILEHFVILVILDAFFFFHIQCSICHFVCLCLVHLYPTTIFGIFNDISIFITFKLVEMDVIILALINKLKILRLTIP